MYSGNRYYSIYDLVCSTITQLFMYVYLEQSRLHIFSSYKQHEVFDKHKYVHNCLRKKGVVICLSILFTSLRLTYLPLKIL